MGCRCSPPSHRGGWGHPCPARQEWPSSLLSWHASDGWAKAPTAPPPPGAPGWPGESPPRSQADHGAGSPGPQGGCLRAAQPASWLRVHSLPGPSLPALSPSAHSPARRPLFRPSHTLTLHGPYPGPSAELAPCPQQRPPKARGRTPVSTGMDAWTERGPSMQPSSAPRGPCIQINAPHSPAPAHTHSLLLPVWASSLRVGWAQPGTSALPCPPRRPQTGIARERRGDQDQGRPAGLPVAMAPSFPAAGRPLVVTLGVFGDSGRKAMWWVPRSRVRGLGLPRDRPAPAPARPGGRGGGGTWTGVRV